MLRWIDYAVKAALIGLLLYAVARPELPQFAGKAMDARLFTYGSSAVVLPLVWLIVRPSLPYPYDIDICIVLPFLMDTLGNTLDLYDSIEWFDDVMHFATWVPWVVAFGLLLRYAPPPPLPRWAQFGLILGFGAVTHILWELLEFVTFIRGGAEEATAYRDTLGDLTLSLTGSFVGALLCVTVLKSATRPVR